MFIWLSIATNTGEPISTNTDIDLARCGLIDVHLAYHRPFCRFGQAFRAQALATLRAMHQETLEPAPAMPSLHSKRLGAGFHPSPTLFVGYRFDAGKAHLSRAPYLLAIGLSHRTSNIHRGLRGVAPPAPPLLRLVCSASGALTSSPLPAAE